MKKLVLYIALIIISAQSVYSVPELAVRYLKLGNTYREAGEYDKSEEYLNKGTALIKGKQGWDNKYWRAVSDEYFGLLYLNLSQDQSNADNKEYFMQLAIEFLNRAVSSYEILLSQKDGSQVPIKTILANLEKSKKIAASFQNTASAGGDVLNYERLKLNEIPLGIPKSVRNLSLADNKYRDFPNGLVNFPQMRYLNLSSNRIRTISPDIEQLSNLNWLDLSNNKIKELPVTFCNLSSLEELNLSNNKLKTLPACLCEMKNLKILNLKGNDLPYSEIANIIKCLPNTNIFIDEYILSDETEKL